MKPLLKKPSITSKRQEPINSTIGQQQKHSSIPSYGSTFNEKSFNSTTKKRNLVETENTTSMITNNVNLTNDRSHSSSTHSNKNVNTNQRQIKKFPSSKTSRPSSSSNSTIDEMARRAFLSSEQQYYNELSKRKQLPTSSSAGNNNSVASIDNLFKMSNDVLHEKVDKPDEKALLAGATDLESVIIVSTEAHIKTTPSPISLDPNHCHFSILEQLQQKIPMVKKHVDFVKSKILEEESQPKYKLKQPSKKTKQAIANQKAFEKSSTSKEFPIISNTRIALRKITRIEPISSKRTSDTKMGHIVLPYELVINIFSFLPWKELYTVIMSVCKNWKEFVTEYEYFIVCEHSRLNLFSANQVLICSGCYNEVPESSKICSHCSNSISDEITDEICVHKLYYKNRLQSKVDKWMLNYWEKHREQVDEMNLKAANTVLTITSTANDNINETHPTHFGSSIHTLSQTCKEYIISQIFPNTWHLTGKGLTIQFVSMFREHLACLHYFPAKIEANTRSLEREKKKKKSEKNKTVIVEPIVNFVFPKLTQIYWNNSTLLDNMTLDTSMSSNFHQLFANVEKFISAQSMFVVMDISRIFESNINRLRVLDLGQCKSLQNHQLETISRILGEHAKKYESDMLDERKCLRKINLSGCGNINQIGLYALAEHCGRTLKW